MGFVMGDPAAEDILAELWKLPDEAIWEALPMEGELPSGFFREASWIATLMLYH